jgi:Rod binding domain-containing protein
VSVTPLVDARAPAREQNNNARAPVREQNNDARAPVREQNNDARAPVREQHRAGAPEHVPAKVVGGRAAPDRAQQARLDAARKFEALLVQQLLQVMRNTAKNGGMMSSSGASGQYLSMFDEMISEKVAEGGGFGLSGTLTEALGGEPGAGQAALVTTSRQPSTSHAVSMHGGISPPLPTLQGATARLAQAAYALSARADGKQWAKQGTLSPADLSSQLETQTAAGTARFNVLDAQGYQDSYKCNLFALEAARRAGFEVPVVARPRGWGFPTSESVTADAQDGALRGGWAEVVSPAQVGELPDKLERGELAVMLTGSGLEGRHGHMAVVERIHHVELDKDGSVKRIDFDGYEARVDGAQHLIRRSWNRSGAGEDQPLARNGFGRIELLALKPAHSAEKPEVMVSSEARASLKDSPSRSP